MTRLVLAEVRSELDVRGTADDKMIVRYIAAAERRIGKVVGPLEPVEQTARVCVVADRFVLPVTPVQSLTSVTPAAVPGGSAVDLSNLDVAGDTGVVRSLIGGFAYGEYDVVFVAGWTTVPEDVLLATTELVKHLWESFGRNGSNGDPAPGSAHALPYRVTELLEGYDSPGFS